MRIVFAIAVSACVSSGNVECPDDTICPQNTVCLEVTQNASPPGFHCVNPGSFADCDGKEELASCTTLTGDPGTCHAGSCFANECGNELRDLDEACDDGNLSSGDGCAAGCNSTEVCGNGIVDPILVIDNVEMPRERCDDSDRAPHDGCSSACDIEVPRWTRFEVGTAEKREAAAMAFDTKRRQFVLFGGANGGSDAPAMTFIGKLEPCGAGKCFSWTPLPLAFTPDARHGHMMVYDEARDRVLLFAGQNKPANPVPLIDIWELDGKKWTQLFVPSAPGARAFSAMAYDPIRNIAVIHGGEVPGLNPTLNEETYEWNGTEWIDGDPTEPMSRHAMAFDPVRGVLVLVGTTVANELVTWHYNAADHRWEDKTPPPPMTNPPPRTLAGLAWDPVRRETVLFGGEVGGVPVGDAWSWDGTRWAALPAMPAPASRMAIATDAAASTIVAFGGRETNPSDTAKLWNGSEWSVVGVASPTTQMAGHAAAFDPVRGRTTIVNRLETWELSGTGWLFRGASPINTQFAAMAYDAKNRKTVLFGGEVGGEVTNKTFVWDGAVWTPFDQAGMAERARAAMAFDADNNRVLLFGGHNDSGIPSNQMFAWNGATWTPVTTQGGPSARTDHAMAYDPVHRKIVVFGGISQGTNKLGDTWLFDTDSETWEQATPTMAPFARSGARMVWNNARRRIVLHGGEAATVLDDVWEWDGSEWTELDVSGRPPPLIGVTLTQSTYGVLHVGGAPDVFELRWDSGLPDELCVDDTDFDGDGALGCDDPDCRAICAPLCVSQATEGPNGGPPAIVCADMAPTCGDGACDPQENCHNCAADCTCEPRCGDRYCDPPETVADCPGDC